MAYNFFSNEDTVPKDFADSIAYLYPDRLFIPEECQNSRILLSPSLPKGRPAVIVSSGGGCFPLPAAYLGETMADAVVFGNVRAAPSAYDIYLAAKRLNCPEGYILIYNNFMGDYLNNDMAAELLALDGFKSIQILANDDMFSVPPDAPRQERTGLDGMLYLIRAASSLANCGMSLEEIAPLLQKVNERMSTATVTLDFDKKIIELGAGFSGEPPAAVLEDAFTPAAAASAVSSLLLDDLKVRPGEKLFLMISPLFKTMPEDSFILGARLVRLLKEAAPVGHVSIGCYTNLLKAYGFYITLLCADETIAPLMGKAFHPYGFVL